MTTVVLVRHGETDWNRNRRIQGWGATPLNDRGREQAAAAARYLAREYDADRLLASDLRRTRETARIVADAVGLEPDFDEAWRERDFGVYQGFTYEDLFDEYPEHDARAVGTVAMETAPEGGESMVAVRERVLDAWERLLAETGPEETALVVTHGGPIYAVLGHLKEIDLVSAILDHRQDNCAINEIRNDPGTGEVEIVRENFTARE